MVVNASNLPVRIQCYFTAQNGSYVYHGPGLYFEGASRKREARIYDNGQIAGEAALRKSNATTGSDTLRELRWTVASDESGRPTLIESYYVSEAGKRVRHGPSVEINWPLRSRTATMFANDWPVSSTSLKF